MNAILNRGEARYIVGVRMKLGRAAHQISGKTRYDRYPEIFRATVDLLPQSSKILSFGCSTGEEVLTLREYFPQATIIGVEINRNRLKICQSLDVDEGIIFVESGKDDVRALGPYDAIFCMAVLQRSPGTVIEKKMENISKLYPFEKFDKQISELDSVLLPGGVIVIKNSHYRFSDASVYGRYKTISSDPSSPVSPVMFDNESAILNDNDYADFAFRKNT